jgi:hypothetical protein
MAWPCARPSAFLGSYRTPGERGQTGTHSIFAGPAAEREPARRLGYRPDKYGYSTCSRRHAALLARGHVVLSPEPGDILGEEQAAGGQVQQGW